MQSTSNPNKQSTLIRLAKLVADQKKWIVVSIICIGGNNLFTAVIPWFIKDVMDSALNAQVREIQDFINLAIGVVLTFGFNGLFVFGQRYSMGYMSQRLLHIIRQNMFNHLQGLSINFYTKSRTGDLISRFTNDLQTLQMALNVGVTGPMRDFPTIFIMLGIMVYRSWELSIFLVLLVPITGYAINFFGKHNNLVTTKRQISFSELSNLITESITGIRVVKAFGMEGYEKKRFLKANDSLFKNYMHTIKISAYSTPTIEIIGAIAAAIIIIFGGYLIIDNKLTIPEFVSFFAAFFFMNKPVKSLNGFILKLQEGLAATDRVFDILDTKALITDHEGSKTLSKFKKDIKININSFKYQNADTNALSNLKLTINKGEIVALVGSSGAGKTTIANLIPRFYDVSDGNILIDDHDLKDIKITSLRELIAIVTQETILFNDTILNNITYGHPESDYQKLLNAAKAANAHEFIENQPKGYDTSIGEKGVLLSGGQKQRLAIARAIIKDAPILILDEATSALDNESEILVQEALNNLMKNRTTIVIAHRLSTIRNADRIVVIEEGSILEEGKHEDLLKLNGRYSELYEMQFDKE